MRSSFLPEKKNWRSSVEKFPWIIKCYWKLCNCVRAHFAWPPPAKRRTTPEGMEWRVMFGNAEVIVLLWRNDGGVLGVLIAGTARHHLAYNSCQLWLPCTLCLRLLGQALLCRGFITLACLSRNSNSLIILWLSDFQENKISRCLMKKTDNYWFFHFIEQVRSA